MKLSTFVQKIHAFLIISDKIRYKYEKESLLILAIISPHHNENCLDIFYGVIALTCIYNAFNAILCFRIILIIVIFVSVEPFKWLQKVFEKKNITCSTFMQKSYALLYIIQNSIRV